MLLDKCKNFMWELNDLPPAVFLIKSKFYIPHFRESKNTRHCLLLVINLTHRIKLCLLLRPSTTVRERKQTIDLHLT